MNKIKFATLDDSLRQIKYKGKTIDIYVHCLCKQYEHNYLTILRNPNYEVNFEIENFLVENLDQDTLLFACRHYHDLKINYNFSGYMHREHKRKRKKKKKNSLDRIVLEEFVGLSDKNAELIKQSFKSADTRARKYSKNIQKLIKESSIIIPRIDENNLYFIVGQYILPEREVEFIKDFLK